MKQTFRSINRLLIARHYTTTKKVYPTHIPTNCIQKAFLAFGSSIVALKNPLRTDMVANLGETTGYFATKRMYKKMQQDEEGRLILSEKPKLHENDEKIGFYYLSKLPSNTLGAQYYEYMSSNGFKPSERPPVRFLDDPELAYVMYRYRQIHDFWHVLSGMPPTTLGELVVKWLEFVQTGLPMNALSSFGGPVLLSKRERRILFSTYVPWAMTAGSQCKNLMSIYYEKYLEMDVDEFRKMINFEKAPSLE